jgi:hypothetical protein
MVNGVNGSKPKAIGQKSKFLAALSIVLLVAVLAIALALSSTGKAPESGNENNLGTSDDLEEDKLVSGVASDLILNQSDMGADWTATQVIVNTSRDLTTVDAVYQAVMSDASISFSQNNSTGHLHYWVDVSVIVFNTADNASTFYDNRTEVHPQDDSRIKPEYRPSYPVPIANVSIGDRCVIHDWPRITLGHEAKALYFVNKNVVCMIAYHDATSYDPLPNELLIDLANKVNAKIASYI